MTPISRFFNLSKKKLLILATLWTLLILAACLIPGKEVPDVHIPFADKWVHFIIFSGFSFLWLCTYTHARAKNGALIFVLSLLLGYAVELLQGSGITTGRSYDVYDIVADGIGGAIGVFLFFALRRLAKKAP